MASGRILRRSERWGRVRRRHLWSILGPDELTELRFLTPVVRRAFLDRVMAGAIRPIEVAAESPLAWLPHLCLRDYLRFCCICYSAAYSTDASKDPKGLYHGFADGRDGGLLSLRPNSRSAFDQWYSSGAYFGSHPWEIVRNSIVLSVHAGRNGAYWLRLGGRQRDAVCSELLLMAIGLSRAGIPFGMENIANHALFAKGNDWIGVADDSIWERGRPDWPTDSGILNAPQNSFLVSELAPFAEAMRRIVWFEERVKIKPLR